MRNVLCAISVMTMLVATAAHGQANCADGTIHDDGGFESGYGSSSFFGASFVMRVDPPAIPASVEAVCVCWQRDGSDSSVFFDIVVWDSDGPGGGPGTLLGRVPAVQASGVPATISGRFYRYNIAQAGIVADRPVYIGPFWDTNDDQDFFVCADESPSTPRRPAYAAAGVFAGLDPPATQLGSVGAFPTYRALGIRAVFDPVTPPPPPPPPPQGDPTPPYSTWLRAPALPGFEIQVRIGGVTQGARETQCIVETICASGALAGRPEIFFKVIGPRPNGFLWTQISRFTPSLVEVWVRQLSTGAIRYYRLSGVGPGSDDVSGLQDRTAFLP